MMDKYRKSIMKLHQMIVLGLFLIAVCSISLIPFSKMAEGAATYKNYEGLETATDSSKTTDTNKLELPTGIANNKDFIQSVNYYISTTPSPSSDKVAIYDIQGKLSGMKSKNAVTLLGEIGTPTNLNNPRTFLQYMNWFGSVCPIDSDACQGL
jgi:hypothetical protein